MPIQSKNDQRLMGMVYVYLERDELPEDLTLAAKVMETARNVSKADAKILSESDKVKTPKHFQTFGEYLVS